MYVCGLLVCIYSFYLCCIDCSFFLFVQPPIQFYVFISLCVCVGGLSVCCWFYLHLFGIPPASFFLVFSVWVVYRSAIFVINVFRFCVLLLFPILGCLIPFLVCRSFFVWCICQF